MIRMRIFLHDEAPRIGCGWRLVSVKVGRDWVRLASIAGRAKIKKAAWAQIARHGVEIPERKRGKRRRQLELFP